LKVGFHVSISGSIDKAVDRAVDLGCTIFQIFTRNPRQWHSTNLDPETAKKFSDKVTKYNMQPVFAHMPYLPNLASPKDDVHKKSIKTLSLELKRCEQLEIPYLVTHLGSHLGKGKETGFERLINGINKVLKDTKGKVTVLLENTAGTKNSMGSTFEDIQHIIERLTHQEYIGVCFDTSHAFAAGYDLRTKEALQETINSIQKTVGFEKIKLVHLNDSKGELNSRIDRHDHIGLGKIGENGFRNILASKFSNLPLIMETPIDNRRDDSGNLKKFKELYRKR
jgi:deoxyribonuclease IV